MSSSLLFKTKQCVVLAAVVLLLVSAAAPDSDTPATTSDLQYALNWLTDTKATEFLSGASTAATTTSSSLCEPLYAMPPFLSAMYGDDAITWERRPCKITSPSRRAHPQHGSSVEQRLIDVLDSSSGRQLLENVAMVRWRHEERRKKEYQSVKNSHAKPKTLIGENVLAELFLTAPVAASTHTTDDINEEAIIHEFLELLRALGERHEQLLGAEGINMESSKLGILLDEDVSMALRDDSTAPAVAGESGKEEFQRLVEDLAAMKRHAQERRTRSDQEQGIEGLTGTEWIQLATQTKSTLILRDADGRDGVLYLLSLLFKFGCLFNTGPSCVHDVGISLYFTPKDGVVSPVPAHIDSMDVLAYQLQGQKVWDVVQSSPSAFLPTRDIGIHLKPAHYYARGKGRRSSGSSSSELKNKRNRYAATSIELQPGDSLFIPRGVIHNTTTASVSEGTQQPSGSSSGSVREEHSIHASVGFDPVPHATLGAFMQYVMGALQAKKQDGAEKNGPCFGPSELGGVLISHLASRLLVLRTSVSSRPPTSVAQQRSPLSKRLRSLVHATSAAMSHDTRLSHHATDPVVDTCLNVLMPATAADSSGGNGVKEVALRTLVQKWCTKAAEAMNPVDAANDITSEKDDVWDSLVWLKAQVKELEKWLLQTGLLVTPQDNMNGAAATSQPPTRFLELVEESMTEDTLFSTVDDWFQLNPRCEKEHMMSVIERVLTAAASPKEGKWSVMVGDAYALLQEAMETMLESNTDEKEDGSTTTASWMSTVVSDFIAEKVWGAWEAERPAYHQWAALNEYYRYRVVSARDGGGVQPAHGSDEL